MSARHWEVLVVAVLIAGIVVTGFSLIATTHQSRILFREGEALRREHDRLQDDWSRLTLEAGTLSGHAEIDALARGELGMVEPGDAIRFVGASR